MKGKTIIRGSGVSYFGRFVATASFNDNTVVAHGTDPDGVRSRAEKQGYKKPVIVYVPKKGAVNLY